MKLGFGKATINPSHPAVKFAPGPFGRMMDVKDELSYKIMMLQKDMRPYLHISCPVADFEWKTTCALKNQMKEILGYDFDLTVGVTHTHYSVNVNKDEEYVTELAHKLCECIQMIELKEYHELKTSFTCEYFDQVGQSRISGQPTKNLFLQTLSIYDGETRLATLIVYNSHPTTLSMKVNYFSSAGPGILMKSLEDKYPNEFFSYMVGAAGDVSTRFTRPGQSYEDMLKMTEPVLLKVMHQLAHQDKLCLMDDYSVEERWLEMDRELLDLSTVEIPPMEELSPRERETLTQSMNREGKMTTDLQSLPKEVMFQRLVLGQHQLIFAPFELFSEYINYINKDNTALVNCGNDRDGYLSGLMKCRLTFELFGQTVGKQGKLRIKKLLEEWSPV